MNEVIIDGVKYIPEHALAARVSIHGMYDMHLFHEIKGKTVDEVIKNWKEHNKKKHPAVVGDREVDDMGVSALCPAIVIDANDKELRRVGSMVFCAYDGSRKPRSEEDVEAYRAALLADPDIPKLLASHDPAHA